MHEHLVLKQEINSMGNFFSEFGHIIDMNLDYFPEMIVVTYSRHSDVRKIIDEKKKVKYLNSK
jgi:hypothetical protein